MTSERPDIDRLLKSGSENPKRIFSALNAEPTKPKEVVITPDEAHKFIRSRYESLQSAEIEDAISFLNSDAGIKQRELSKEFSQLVRLLLSGSTSIAGAPSDKAEKVQQFFKAAGVLDALNSIPSGPDPVPRQKVLQYAIDFYADKLSEDELDSLIVHYSSSAGKASVGAALSLSKEILQEYGI